MRIIFLVTILSLGLYSSIFAKTFTISGYVQEASSGEKIIGAAIYEATSMAGTSTNSYGFFSLSLPEGKVHIVVSNVGFADYTLDTLLNKDILLNIGLESIVNIEKVVISKNKKSTIHETTQMSSVSITGKDIKKIPTVLGEPDLIKALQLLPGVHGGNEGSAGFYVRGGGPDQNLILLDGAPLYNVTHLFGFFSTFNPDAINNVNLIKGGFPARYGGRISSVLDISMKEGNMKEYHGEASVGIVAARFSLEGPIVKNKASFIISARRTYLDVLAAPFIAAAAGGAGTAGVYFYDLNAKVNYKISENDRIYLSFYNGLDDFYLKANIDAIKISSGLNWGNLTGTTRWNHIVNQKMFMNTSLIFSRYNFNVNDGVETTYSDPVTGTNSTSSMKINYDSGIKDYMAKVDFDYIPNNKHYLRFGANHTYHTFTTGVLAMKANIANFNLDTTLGAKPFISNESHLYIEDDYKVTDKLKVNMGLHFSNAILRGKLFPSVEPRLAVRYLLDKRTSIKASYSYMRQYVHLLSTSTIGLPTDLWVPATDSVPPQNGWQVALGLARPFLIKDEVFEVSVEGYYKKMNNVIAYKEGASYFGFNQSWESKVEVGHGEAYGAEFLVQKKYGKLSGWVGYTLSWTNRQFNNINNGRTIPYRYDRRHDISIVCMYDFNEHISISANWVYGTGNAVTLPQYKYTAPAIGDYAGYLGNGNGSQTVTQPNSINSFNMPAMHRLDVSISFKKQKKYGEQTWVLGAYNVYNRQNPFFLYELNNKIYQISLFPVIPSISYNYKF